MKQIAFNYVDKSTLVLGIKDRLIMITQIIFTSLITFFSLAVAKPANDLEKLTMEDLNKAVALYHSCCDTDEQGKKRPGSESEVFGFVTELREKFPCVNDSKDFFLYFPSSYFYEKGKHNGESFSFRLDIEGETFKETVDGTKKYVRLQLQNHTGTNNSYASILVPTDIPFHVHLLYLSLQLSFVRYFDGADNTEEQSVNYKKIEDMKKYPAGKAHQPQDICLDDQIFTEKNKHTRKKLDNIREKGEAIAWFTKALKQFFELRRSFEAIKSLVGKNKKIIVFNNFVEQYYELKKILDSKSLPKDSVEFIKEIEKIITQEKVEYTTLGNTLDKLTDTLKREVKTLGEKSLSDIKHDKCTQEQKRKQSEEARLNNKLPRKHKSV